MEKYRIEKGVVYEFSAKHNAYICVGRTTQYTKKQLAIMSKELIQNNEDGNQR